MNLVNVQGEIKAIVEECTGTPTAKLIAILNAAGITSTAEIASMVGVAIRTVQHAKKSSKSATDCAKAQPIAAQPIASGATDCAKAQLIAFPARVLDNNINNNHIGASKPKSDRAKPATSCKRGSRLPDDWVLPKSWGDWALTNFPQATEAAVREMAEDFADYWHGVAGQKGTKLDWLATWRRWCRSNFRTAPVRGGYAKHAKPAEAPKINYNALVSAADRELYRNARPAE